MAFQFVNSSVRLPATPSEVAGRFDVSGDDWWMTDSERLALTGLLAELRPECAIEVGVFRAGSLSVLARFSRSVYALDIDPQCEAQFASQFPNVRFITGDAGDTLPRVLERITATGESLGFVLIDADHSRDGVRRDIESILAYRPTRPLYIVMHDSFNPECRRGMKEAAWASNPHVHLVELDFVTGRLVTEEEPDSNREMWCGFALAALLPQPRTAPLTIHENEALLFQSALRHSVYRYQRWWNPRHLARELGYHGKQALKARAPALYETLRRRLKRARG